MGVSGSGKSTVGKALSEATGLDYLDADDYHSEANIMKMKSGQPLNDNDRMPWLQKLRSVIEEQIDSIGCILGCSALKESYRKILDPNKDPMINWVILQSSFDVIQERLMGRKAHFFNADLLQSQFETLELPEYGLHVKADKPVREIVELVMSTFKLNADIGIIGLGTMGTGIARNLASKGFKVAIFNKDQPGEVGRADDFVKQYGHEGRFVKCRDIEELINNIQGPRIVWLMVTAGQAVDAVLQEVSLKLESGDIIIDGGNSHFKETRSRSQRLAAQGIHFFGIGVSGGEEGALHGPSIMPGGPEEVYSVLEPFLKAVSAKDKTDKACCTYIGPGGSGHFIKMVHNGLEYVEMQLLAEIYSLLRPTYSNQEIADILSAWNDSDLGSYLLEITINILRKKEKDDLILNRIADIASGKGTGTWTAISAYELSSAYTMINAAVNFRTISANKEMRNSLHSRLSVDQRIEITVDLEVLASAYRMARIINHHQGFSLIANASDHYNWEIDLSEVARIWTSGCIIRSALMEQLQNDIQASDTVLTNKAFLESTKSSFGDLRTVIKLAADNAIGLPCFSSAFNFWLNATNTDLPANLIQAQRDYFGNHGYLLKDDPDGSLQNTNWN